MVGTMLPIGYGERTQGRLPRSLIGYGTGSVIAAVTLGLVVGGAGRVTFLALSASTRVTMTAAVTGLIGIMYGMSDASLVSVPLPQSHRQVPASWYKRFRPGVAGLMYGAGLGLGFATRIPVATYYILPVWGFFSGEVLLSGLVLGLFGVGRFIPLLLIGTKRAADGEALESLIHRLEAFEPVVKLLNGLILSVVGVYLLVSLLRLS